MIKIEILFFIILPFVVSATSLRDVMLLLLNQRIDHELTELVEQGSGARDTDGENTQSNTEDTEESYEAFTRGSTTSYNKLMSWLYDEKVDKLVHHLEALERLKRDSDKDWKLENSDSAESSEKYTDKQRSEMESVLQDCGFGKICIGPIQPNILNETNNKSSSVDSDESFVATDSESIESEINTSKTDTTLATSTSKPSTANVISDNLSENWDPLSPYNDNGQWIPYRLLRDVKDVTTKLSGNILNNKKYARIGPIIFEDNIAKVKDSNEYTVKDIKQVILTNPADGEPKGIIVAENRKFSLDYIDLGDVSSDKQMPKRNAKDNNNRADLEDRFRKSTDKKNLKIKKAQVKRSDAKQKTGKISTHSQQFLRTRAQERKKLAQIQRMKLSQKNKASKSEFVNKKRQGKANKSWGDSSGNTKSDEDNYNTPMKPQGKPAKPVSESYEVAPKKQKNKLKRFQVTKNTAKGRQKKTSSSYYTPVVMDKTTETLESLSEEVTTKKAIKKLKSKARIPGKPEHYMQSYGRLYEEGQDFRRRLEQFMPKRYHWDPADFSKLGYFWFNGHQGKNPPGNYKIAY